MLVVVGGLPGAGKSAVASLVCQESGFGYVRIDAIEQAMRDSGEIPGGPVIAGYAVGYALAREQLCLGLGVLVECVNPLPVTRDAWRNVAAASDKPILEVELVCSDEAVHRHRVETRRVNVPGLTLPTWDEVQAHDYEPWDRPHLVIDTSTASIAEARDTIMSRLLTA
jgi:predicted kinase